ncbi:BQ5605_C045g12191 [Microbotryum silenes-dioicae]|uniref:BQ5605_C045g12191 protein n=1 Tax=Microbotryum silenes-dioicae TaxID=796604 RepID=A0A2X0PPV9_9BASI|nr:BQ5605_C045g12191 [Microbotryum silenes-dioicae]
MDILYNLLAAPLLDVRVSELFASSFDKPDTRIQLSWSTDKPLEFECLVLRAVPEHGP